MKATAKQLSAGALAHRIEIRRHALVSDEPRDQGGDDSGPTPQELLAASLAACTAITLEMYAQRKQWAIGPVEVECEYSQAERGQPTELRLVLRLPNTCSEEQVERLRAIAAKCPVHRTLQGHVTFAERVELVSR
jgi:putative redox protein